MPAELIVEATETEHGPFYTLITWERILASSGATNKQGGPASGNALKQEEENEKRSEEGGEQEEEEEDSDDDSSLSEATAEDGDFSGSVGKQDEEAAEDIPVEALVSRVWWNPMFDDILDKEEAVPMQPQLVKAPFALPPKKIAEPRVDPARACASAGAAV